MGTESDSVCETDFLISHDPCLCMVPWFGGRDFVCPFFYIVKFNLEPSGTIPLDRPLPCKAVTHAVF